MSDEKNRQIMSLDHIKTINKIERICNYEIPADERIKLIRIEIDGWRKE